MARPRVTVDIDVTTLKRQLRAIGDRSDKAFASGLNDAAFELRRKWISDIDRRIHKPKAFTRKVFVKKARDNNLVATTFIPRIQSEYLRNIIEGRDRTPGQIGTLSSSTLVPVKARLTVQGNFPRGSAVRWLATVEQRLKGAFVGTPGRGRALDGGLGDSPAVYQRQKSGQLKLLAVFRQRVSYNKQLPLDRTTEEFVPEVDSIIQRNVERFIR